MFSHFKQFMKRMELNATLSIVLCFLYFKWDFLGQNVKQSMRKVTVTQRNISPPKM